MQIAKRDIPLEIVGRVILTHCQTVPVVELQTVDSGLHTVFDCRIQIRSGNHLVADELKMEPVIANLE